MNYSLKPGSTKPIPREYQAQGREASLPMHVLRSPFLASLRPVVNRNPRNTRTVALQLLQSRELTREQLGDELHRRFPDHGPLLIDRLVAHLVTRGDVLIDDRGLIGLTAKGANVAEALHGIPGNIDDHPIARRLPRLAEPIVPPVVERVDPALATGSANRRSSSDADNRTPPVRPGADDALRLPSRIGNHLHYRSGLITDMAGNVLCQATRGEQIYRPTRSGGERARPVYPSNH